MSQEPTVIYSAASLQQAYFLRGLLEERGIKAVVVNDAIQIAGGELPLGWTAAAKVVVPQEHAAAARQVAETLDRPAPAHGNTVSSEHVLEWAEWPRCSTCQTKRSARCPICHTTGTDFPLADYQPNSEGERILLLCATCDDHMRPQWYRTCAHCGHDFGDGIAPPQLQNPTIPWDPLFAWLLAGMLLAAIAVTGYFFWLFR